MKSRAQRRHDANRMEARARKVVRRWTLDDTPRLQFDEKAHARRMRDNLKPCSCPMCGNPRRYWHEPTIQERRRLQDDE